MEGSAVLIEISDGLAIFQEMGAPDSRLALSQ